MEYSEESITWDLFLKEFHSKEKSLKELTIEQRALVKEFGQDSHKRAEVESAFLRLSAIQHNVSKNSEHLSEVLDFAALQKCTF